MSRKRNESIKMTLVAEKIWHISQKRMNTPAPREKIAGSRSKKAERPISFKPSGKLTRFSAAQPLKAQLQY